MGAIDIADSCQRCGLRRHEAAQTKRGGILSSTKSIVNEKGAHFARSMHADGVDAFDVARGGGSRDED